MRAAREVDSDVQPLIVHAAAQIGGIEKFLAVVPQLEDHGIKPARRSRLKRMPSCGEVQRVAETGDIDVSGRIEGNPEPVIFAAAADICRIRHPCALRLYLRNKGVRWSSLE